MGGFAELTLQPRQLQALLVEVLELLLKLAETRTGCVDLTFELLIQLDRLLLPMKYQFPYFIHQSLDLTTTLDLLKMQLLRFIAERIFDVLCLLEVKLLLTVFKDQLCMSRRQICKNSLDYLGAPVEDDVALFIDSIAKLDFSNSSLRYLLDCSSNLHEVSLAQFTLSADRVPDSVVNASIC